MQVEQLTELGEIEQKQVDKVVDILSTLTTQGQEVAEIAHDARNMVTALDLYCDLLQEPGVLASPFSHYCGELRLVAAASRRLIDKLMSIDVPNEREKHDTAEPSQTHAAQIERGTHPGTQVCRSNSQVLY